MPVSLFTVKNSLTSQLSACLSLFTGKNFIYQLCRNLQAAKEMKVPTDQINTPTYNRDLAACTKLLVEANASGVYNIGGSDVLGRYDVLDGL